MEKDGKVTFRWSGPAEEVYVTGSFDNWTKTKRLDKVGDVFETTVDEIDTTKVIYYKFVVDNSWVVDPDADKHIEGGYVNNVLKPKPVEKIDQSTPTVPPLADMNTSDDSLSNEKQEPQTDDSLGNPVPTASPQADTKTGDTAAVDKGMPGAFPGTPGETPNANGTPGNMLLINPLPATQGAVNPKENGTGNNIARGTDADISKYVTLDKDSYEQSDRLPGVPGVKATDSDNQPTATALPEPMGFPAISSAAPASSTALLAVGALHDQPTATALGPETKDFPAIISAAPVSSTALLATAAPLEVPNQEGAKDGTGPGAPSASKVATSMGAVAVGATGAIGVMVAATAQAIPPAVDTVIGKVSDTATQVEQAVNSVAANAVPAIKDLATTTTKEPEISPEVPAPMKGSILEVQEPPEAAANTEAVEAKEVVDQQLLSEVEPVAPTGKGPEISPEVPAPVKDSILVAQESPEAAANTEAVESKKAVEQQLLGEVEPVATTSTKDSEISPEVPTPVKDSILDAQEPPEAAANTEAVEGKKAVGQQLLREVEPAKETDTTKEAEFAEDTKAAESVPEGLTKATDNDDTKMSVLEVPEPSAQPTAGAPLGESTMNGSGAPGTEPTKTPTEESVEAGPVTPAKAPVAALAAQSPAASKEKKKKNPIRKILDRFKEKVHKDKA